MVLKTKVPRALGTWARNAALVAVLFAASLAQAFDVVDVDGKRHRLADYRGKWVVVNFWATWCAPCVKEIPEIAEFSRGKSAARVAVLGIALDVDDPAKTRKFADRIGHTYPLVLEDDSIEKQFGKVKGLPTTFVYDPSGRRSWSRTGTVTKKDLEEATASPGMPKA